ncbi:TetR/AcrR family transcriptional regulator [Acinetobacter dispersus]|uniref:HTH tetR-type domain-containing protein n=1 Tax=Acinetobacter dispersus TaxID=70348 RepID=N9MR62_9GAMM|nr:TetR/AcrR family transcriptional regulator [Acinetobacter dispersus]ENW93256.1 hypothetical protein F904_03203 [Acinetobacter dispersus]
MPSFSQSSRAVCAFETAICLFNQYGFNNIGVDRIIETSQIAKASFYKYFQSKEQLIEICLSDQRKALKKEVHWVINTHKNLSVHEKLTRIFDLHANLDGSYHLLFKAIFEIEKRYPDAYQIVVEYRNWLIEEVYKLLLVDHVNASEVDAQMFLFVVDGVMVLLLGGSGVDDPEQLIEGFLVGVG